VRVLSLVPSDASDIRDTSAETFSDLDQRAFRANLFVVIGGVLLVLAGLLALLALVRLFARYRKPAAVSDRLIGDATILRGVGREFAAVRRQREDSGWSPELAGRALAALRVAATYAVGRRVGHLPAIPLSTTGGLESAEAGRLVLQAGWPRGKRIAVSGAITRQTVAAELARAAATSDARRMALLGSLEQALSSLTIAQYGRETAMDDAALDQALATGVTLLRRMKLEQLWFMKRLAARRAGSPLDNRAWSR
jgi:hypothetical protein